MNYMNILPRVIDKYEGKGEYRFKFEKYDCNLSLKAFTTACLCVAKSRPNNFSITKLAWPVMADEYGKVSTYAFDTFQWNSIVQIDYRQSEELKQAVSKSGRNLNNGNSKGIIVAIDINTYKPKFIYGPGDARAFGFNPENIYSVINKRNDFTHRGHVFVREHEVFDNE